MVSVDEHTQVAIEIVSESSKLTGELILKILKEANKLFDDKANNPKNSILTDNTKNGKQRIEQLKEKHKDGISALEENINKEQAKDYMKELKKLGVDFSIVKNEKDNYSFFFASKDSNILEKALKNIVEKKNIEIEKEKSKEPSKIDNIKQVTIEIVSDKAKLTKDLILKMFMEVNNLIDGKISNFKNSVITSDTKNGKQRIEQLKKKHKNGIKTLDENITKKQAQEYTKELKKLGIDFSIVKNEKDNYSFFFASKDSSFLKATLESIIDENVNDLDNSEKKDITKQNKKGKNELDKDLTKLEKELTELEKESTLMDKVIAENKIKAAKREQKELEFKEVFNKPFVFEDKEKPTFKEITTYLTVDEKQLFIQKGRMDSEKLDNHYSDYTKHEQTNKYREMLKNFNPEQEKKVNVLYDKFIDTSNVKIMIDTTNPTHEKGKIHCDTLSNINFKNIEKSKEKNQKIEEPSIFSLKGVKNIDNKIKLEEKKQSKEKVKNNHLER